MREPAHHRVPWRPLTSAVLAPLVWFNDSALEHRSVGFQVLSDGLETELVEAAERGQAGRIKSRVGHVEVFRMGSVGTSIFRETSTPTRTATRSTDYTLVREEPVKYKPARNGGIAPYVELITQTAGSTSPLRYLPDPNQHPGQLPIAEVVVGPQAGPRDKRFVEDLLKQHDYDGVTVRQSTAAMG